MLVCYYFNISLFLTNLINNHVIKLIVPGIKSMQKYNLNCDIVSLFDIPFVGLLGNILYVKY